MVIMLEYPIMELSLSMFGIALVGVQCEQESAEQTALGGSGGQP